MYVSKNSIKLKPLITVIDICRIRTYSNMIESSLSILNPLN